MTNNELKTIYEKIAIFQDEAPEIGINAANILSNAVKIAETISNNENVQEMIADTVEFIADGAARAMEHLTYYMATIDDTVYNTARMVEGMKRELTIPEKVKIAKHAASIKRSWKEIKSTFKNLSL